MLSACMALFSLFPPRLHVARVRVPPPVLVPFAFAAAVLFLLLLEDAI